ncbi:glycosyltransferase family 8 protein [Parabacteroides faecis]|uniref:Lipopolysaccharide biosynthesis glycosyltransferase n=1 Tax=Parabacteroides faecis TaxID=1217282 RepID=A0ABR6KHY7_9BACT|nr:glycosyltransferase family 8 protein [Parabacteroides faecis]MBB4621123.1 lipopolysaccharide biosynthesis glycosyltransferase [Parabacteroides faecis]GGJ89012.1 LPS 1,2-glucosyltransferase [Parabacteroides faecis]
MIIACATDDNFIQHCSVMLTSLFENNKKEDIVVYLLTEGLKEISQRYIKNIELIYKCKIQICNINIALLNDFPLFPGDHVSIVTYFRLLLPDIIDNKISKILYLDSDIIITGSLKPLWDIKLTAPIAAVPESTSYQPENYKRLQYDSKYSYFNAGVILINLEYWRSHQLIDRFRDYLIKYPERVRWHDQDILNAVLHNNWLRLPIRWNALEGYFHTSFYRNTKLNKKNKIEIINEITNPIIVHYCAKNKPWCWGNNHPLKNLYFTYLEKTEWKYYNPKLTISKDNIKIIIRNILVLLRIKKTLFINIQQKDNNQI